MTRLDRILIIGKTPPPYGGVTIYTKRILDHLHKKEVSHKFLYLKASKLLNILMAIVKTDIIHLIVSQPFARLLFVVVGVVFRKKVIIFFPGEINRYSFWLYNFVDRLCVRLAHAPVVLNDKSFKIAKKMNDSAVISTSFIPPDLSKVNDVTKISEELKGFVNSGNFIFCTNASHYALDKNGDEIYGIVNLVEIFIKYENINLIIADPSGDYKAFFDNSDISLAKNIYIVNNDKISFLDILNISHVMIRATSTDGSSLSINEALYMNKIVISSDCVSRPESCVLYSTGDVKELEEKIVNTYNGDSFNAKNKLPENGFNHMLDIYESFSV